MKRSLTLFILFFSPLLTVDKAVAQDFYFGNDLSYVNQMEDCGADFKEWMQSKDIYDLYAEHDNNLVRVRLWVDPVWQEGLDQPAGVKPVYSNFEDVRETIQRSKAAGMQVLLDLHYSDFWADPGRQVIPSRWYDVAFDDQALADSIYNYTHKVLSDLNSEGLMPEMVQVGNETNSGMMTHRSMDQNFEATELISNSWQRHAKMFNAGIQAVRDVSALSTIDTKVALHYAGVGSGLDWWYQNAVSSGITDFDVIGFSYYYAWHGSTIEAVGDQIESLSQSYPDKEIIILETGYPWTDKNFDSNGNIIADTTPEYSPASPAVQLDYLVNLTKEVMASGGDGVIFWESAWVTTSCTTPWATGSSHDHVVFFEPFTDNFIGSGGGLWMDPDFYSDMNSVQVIYKVDMNGQDQSGGVYIAIDENEDGSKVSRRMYHEGDGIYNYTTYLSPGKETTSFFHTGSDPQNRESVPAACATSGDRVITVGNENMLTGYQWGTCEAIAGSGSQDLTLTVAVNMEGQDTGNGVYVTGDFTAENGSGWSIEPMQHEEGSVYSYTVSVEPGEEGGYYFLNGNNWTDRETVPQACVGYYDADRGYFIENESVSQAYYFGSCNTFDFVATSVDEEADVPQKAALHQNYPNPFNPTTVIPYDVNEPAMVDLKLYNMLGQEVRTLVSGFKGAGTYYYNLNAGNLPTGTYIYKLNTGSYSDDKKLTLIK